MFSPRPLKCALWALGFVLSAAYGSRFLETSGMPHSAFAGLGTLLGAGGKSAASGQASVSAGGEAVGG